VSVRWRILVVDDSATIRTILKAAVELGAPRDSVEVREATSVEEALVCLADVRIDLLMLDRNMPRVDGLALVKQLRDKGSELPIVMISAVADAAQIAEATRLGVSDYITKPFQMAELWKRVSVHLRG
jgi:DNA-binding response OmpR family regulator